MTARACVVRHDGGSEVTSGPALWGLQSPPPRHPGERRPWFWFSSLSDTIVTWPAVRLQNDLHQHDGWANDNKAEHLATTELLGEAWVGREWVDVKVYVKQKLDKARFCWVKVDKCFSFFCPSLSLPGLMLDNLILFNWYFSWINKHLLLSQSKWNPRPFIFVLLVTRNITLCYTLKNWIIITTIIIISSSSSESL